MRGPLAPAGAWALVPACLAVRPLAAQRRSAAGARPARRPMPSPGCSASSRPRPAQLPGHAGVHGGGVSCPVRARAALLRRAPDLRAPGTAGRRQTAAVPPQRPVHTLWPRTRGGRDRAPRPGGGVSRLAGGHRAAAAGELRVAQKARQERVAGREADGAAAQAARRPALSRSGCGPTAQPACCCAPTCSARRRGAGVVGVLRCRARRQAAPRADAASR